MSRHEAGFTIAMYAFASITPCYALKHTKKAVPAENVRWAKSDTSDTVLVTKGYNLGLFLCFTLHQTHIVRLCHTIGLTC